MVLGYCYYRQVKMRTIVTALAVSLLLLLGLLMGNLVSFCPMQDHKFPPDYLFLVYNMVVLCVFSLVFSKVRIPQNRWLQLWNVRGYTLYLYQSIVYFGMFAVYLGAVSKIGNHLVEGLICVPLMFVLSTIASYLTYPLERWVMKRFF